MFRTFLLSVRPSEDSFRSLEQRAIKEGLTNILGTGSAVAVIVNFNLDELSDDGPSLHRSLFGLFGTSATEVLEREIVRILYEKIGVSAPPSKKFDFVSALKRARQIRKNQLQS